MPRLKTKGQSRRWEASRVGEEAKQREEKRSDFCTGSPARLLPGPDKSVAVPRARPQEWTLEPRREATHHSGPAWPTVPGPPPARRQARGAAGLQRTRGSGEDPKTHTEYRRLP